MTGDRVDTGEEPATVSNFQKNFTWEKLHALGYGFGIAFLAAVSASPWILAAYLSILLWALGIRGSPTRVTKSGDKKCDRLETEIEERSSDGRGHGLHAQLLVEIRHKPHYFGMGGVVGDRLGYGVHWWWFDVPPDHYQHLPEMVRFLGMGM